MVGFINVLSQKPYLSHRNDDDIHERLHYRTQVVYVSPQVISLGIPCVQWK
jgi:hypothetical protein